MQKTLSTAVVFNGVGLHSGKPASMRLCPAPADHGLWFKRSDLDARDAMIPAMWHAVEQGELCTLIRNAAGASVSTIEHVMAAVAGCGIHNLLIEIDGPEVPILDGSAAPFVAAILEAGLQDQTRPIRALRLRDVVEVRNGPAYARLEPADGLEIDFSIDFADAAIGHQKKRLSLANGTFVHELCDSRTFCRASDVDAMRERGLALGGTYHNAVVVDGAEVLSPGGLRHADEAVRHKMLDALGDLALAGMPILGRYTGVRSGHALTNALLRALFARPAAFEVVEVDAQMMARLPGAGLRTEDAPSLAA
ncbi:UDP-3-O-[3-hydroxymyristoyl] N-acetylglucosamine deacetylase [Rhodobacteraceae bacterium THAF1]|uniref:UDP-3-O-acyl-N-acetylglucosamine deacetylase n=1 Tax=Palleronia sp. THAF1 TaxID=2587842 RepID=UPI000F418572|nr:UDP-3-O-acyl-N-acetylglucosamine deacetylase [Palleronia sp. THAF1]QFU09273.1 UDP-3-O-[3-hydroxymyristoyl] N-acetylglucosamine deacetylase [Palleronia sp. THAF1]VDC26580.1 UDP-3-O-[3-hydroxymyristoyl] N-acetylglucosamine deacetylase [Rhodobacteraceae bacterium THAF1]